MLVFIGRAADISPYTTCYKACPNDLREDEAKWQMCEKRARLLAIEALLQSDPSNKEECKFAFEQFADDVYVARIHAVMGKRYGGGLLWQSLKQSRSVLVKS